MAESHKSMSTSDLTSKSIVKKKKKKKKIYTTFQKLGVCKIILLTKAAFVSKNINIVKYYNL